MNETYLRTARLLTHVAPSVFVDDTFARKGGTAINLFYRNLPRLSVDLDLVFRDHTVPRVDALAQIDTAIRAMSTRLRARGFTTRAPISVDSETKLVVQRDGITVKIEVNTVMRGAVHPVQSAALSARASDILQTDLELPVTSLEYTYGGKLAAALDRRTRGICSMCCSCSRGHHAGNTARICCVCREPQPPRTRALVSSRSGHCARIQRKLCRHDGDDMGEPRVYRAL